MKLIARLDEADTDGLDPAVYRTPPIGMGELVPAIDRGRRPRRGACSARRIVTYARHAYAGRLEPAAVSQNFGYDRAPARSGRGARRASPRADDPAAALAAYNPTQPEFIALRDKLAEIRGERRSSARRWCRPART